MDNQPLVSILIPNYNKAPYLRETLDSILAQTYTNWECIIVDDHSTDDSLEIFEDYEKKDSRFKIYRRPDHLPKGGNAARNYAFQLSKGKYVNWFDSDDVMNSKFISEKIKALLQNQRLDFVISDLKAFSISISNWFNYNSLDLSQKNINYAIEALKGTYWIQTSLPLFKKEFIQGFELFNNKLLRGQEAEFFNRILLSQPKFEFKPESVCYWRHSGESKTREFEICSDIKKSQITFQTHFLIIKDFIKANSLYHESIIFFNKQLNKHLRYLPLFSLDYLKLIYLIYGLYKKMPSDIPIKIMGRRILKLEDWK